MKALPTGILIHTGGPDTCFRVVLKYNHFIRNLQTVIVVNFTPIILVRRVKLIRNSVISVITVSALSN